MLTRKQIIDGLLAQAREKVLEHGETSIAENDATVLREAAQLLNADADLRDVHEATMRANTELRKKQEPALIVNRNGWPVGNRDTLTGLCPECGNLLVCITPGYCSAKGFWCNMCGQRIRFV